MGCASSKAAVDATATAFIPLDDSSQYDTKGTSRSQSSLPISLNSPQVPEEAPVAHIEVIDRHFVAAQAAIEHHLSTSDMSSSTYSVQWRLPNAVEDMGTLSTEEPTVMDVNIIPHDQNASSRPETVSVQIDGDKLFSPSNGDIVVKCAKMKAGAKATFKKSRTVPESIVQMANQMVSTTDSPPRKKKVVGFSSEVQTSPSVTHDVSSSSSSSPDFGPAPRVPSTRLGPSMSMNSPVATLNRPLFTRGGMVSRTKSVRSPSDRAELIVLGDHDHDESAEEGTVQQIDCDVCHLSKEKGVFCDSFDHFICHNCFANHVESLCRDASSFKTSKSAVSCPCGGCTSAPWNSYHMRKILTNGHDSVLELYLSTMMLMMQELNFNRSVGMSPSPVKRGKGSTPYVISREASLHQPEVSVEPTNTAATESSDNSLQKVVTKVASGTSEPSSHQDVQPVVINFTDDELREEFEKMRETIKILRKQLMDHNIDAAEYIPLENIQEELQGLFAKANQGEPYDEGRMDYLLMCLENNPDYIQKKEDEQRQWREQNIAFAKQCYNEMLAYVPPDIFSASISRLRDEYKFSADFAKRLISKKCLWLIRCEMADIEKLHEADLMGRFTFEAQGLDVVELAALFAATPEKFSSDSTGRKQTWRNNLEFSLKKLLTDQAQGRLEKKKIRNPLYAKEKPLFGDDRRLHRLRDETNDAAITMNESFIMNNPPGSNNEPPRGSESAAVSPKATKDPEMVPLGDIFQDKSSTFEGSISTSKVAMVVDTSTSSVTTPNTASTTTSNPSPASSSLVEALKNTPRGSLRPVAKVHLPEEHSAPSSENGTDSTATTPRQNPLAVAAAAVAATMAAKRRVSAEGHLQ